MRKKCSKLPGVFVRKIGGGGRFVPLIGDIQPLSLISSCKIVRYDVTTQNSSKSMVISQLVAFRLFELLMSLWDLTMSDKFSICNKFCEQPKKFKAHRHWSNVIRSTSLFTECTPKVRSNALRIVLKLKISFEIINVTFFNNKFMRKHSVRITFTNINFEATFCGAEKHVPVKMAFVCCKPDGTSSNTGKPLRETISRNSCWFLFRSIYSLQTQIHLLLII